VVNTLLTRNTQIMHATLGEHVTATAPLLARSWGRSTELAHPAGLNATVTEQASMIAYNKRFQIDDGVESGCDPIGFPAAKPCGST